MIINLNDRDDVQAVLNAHQATLESTEETIINFAPGVYNGRVRLFGKNIRVTAKAPAIIVNAQGAEELGHNKTFYTATFLCEGENIQVNDLVIINNAGQGEKVGQAVALYTNGDRLTFNRCAFIGNQDTLCIGPIISQNRDGTKTQTPVRQPRLKRARNIFNHCLITGNIDYIFGGGAAWFRNCRINSTRSGKVGEGYICAPCTPAGQLFGFIFDHCRITANSDVGDHFLGRPWRPYARAYFIHCQLAPTFVKNGWHIWGDDPTSVRRCDFREYASQPSAQHQSWAWAADHEDEMLRVKINHYFNFTEEK